MAAFNQIVAVGGKVLTGWMVDGDPGIDFFAHPTGRTPQVRFLRRLNGALPFVLLEFRDVATGRSGHHAHEAGGQRIQEIENEWEFWKWMLDTTVALVNAG